MNLLSLRGGSDPEPMTDQDIADWGGSVDARSNVSASGRKTPESVLAAGQAVVDVTNARRGKS